MMTARPKYLHELADLDRMAERWRAAHAARHEREPDLKYAGSRTPWRDCPICEAQRREER